MNKIISWTVTILLVTVFNSCENSTVQLPTEPITIELTPRSNEVITTSNNFGIELFTKTAVDENRNMMLSPLSASIALTMLLNGADGNTYTQLRQMLGYPENMTTEDINKAYQNLVAQLLTADPQVKLAIANAIFYRHDFSFKAPYIRTMAKDFDATVEGLDFTLPKAIETINQWAGDNTNQRIPHVIDEISDQMVMFLMNALYFKGNWSDKFNPDNTTDRYFTLDNGEKILTSTMEGKVMARMYYGTGYAALELPYGRKNFSMIIIVPDGKLKDFYPIFTPDLWGEITVSLGAQQDWREIMVNLPKFKFEYEKTLNNQLRTLGMQDAFIPYVANLSGISDEELYVSFVKQNSFIEVNEEGTEAAAVTTIGVEVTSMPPQFIVNKPFIFAIRERTTNTLLFIGSITNPAI